MKYYILVSEENNSASAVAAFSRQDKEQDYERKVHLPHSRCQLLDLENDKNAKRIFAAHKRIDDTHFKLTGCYTNRYDSLKSAGPTGFVNEMVVDHPEENHKVERPKKIPFQTKTLDRLNGVSPSVEKKIDERRGNLGLSAKELHILNQHVTQPSKVEPEAKPAEDWKWDKKMKTRLSIAGLIGGVCAFVLATKALFPGVQFDENASTVDWLPKACQDVSFYLSEEASAYEFTVPYASFEYWAKTNGVVFDTIKTGESVVVPTYRFLASSLTKEVSVSEMNRRKTDWEGKAYMKIENGFQIVGLKDEAGLEVNGGYDLNTGKVYFWSKEA